MIGCKDYGETVAFGLRTGHVGLVLRALLLGRLTSSVASVAGSIVGRRLLLGMGLSPPGLGHSIKVCEKNK